MKWQSLPASFVVSAQAAPTVESFLGGAEATRGDLQQLLRSTNKIANQQLPPALVQLSKSLEAAQATAETVNSQLPGMSAALMSTLQVYAKTGESADQISREALTTLQALRPDLLQSLREFSVLMRRSNALMEQFSVLLTPIASDESPNPKPSAAPGR